MLCSQTGIWMLAAAMLGPAASPRQEVSLNGQWDCCLVEDLSIPAPKDGWRPCNVPGYLNGSDYQRAWFQRSFVVPAAMKGQRIKIHFGGVKYNSRVYVNGKDVGACFGGYQPFEVDVTDAVHFDRTNQLLVGCHDWTGIFTAGKVDFSRKQEWDRIRSVPRDKILAPIGGLYGLYGIWDDVTLRSRPAVYVKDLFIKPSVRRGELVVDYTVTNESAAEATVELSAVVEDDGSDLRRISPVRVRIPAGGTTTTSVRQPWPDARLWSHVDPYLYHLRTELSSGDVSRTRFGFREFWVEGPFFYLNGTKINLLATSWWPPHGPMTREEIRKRWEAVKECGCIAFRTHTQPWRSIHYDVADELGLLMVIEGAVWNDESVYRINDPVFWDNYASHLKAMIDRDKNRPSVVMWSLENEFYGGRLNDEAAAKADLIRMGKLVRQWDPTRPLFYESDGDPGGVADCIGIHYPHEYPQFTCWPNEADWLAQPATIPHMFHEGQDTFSWTKNKPVYVGEFLWLPSSEPSWHTVFFGDDAYRDYRRFRNLGKAESWKMQILGYRHHDVAGISPWTVIEGGPLDDTNALYRAHQYAYQHIAAYCHDYDSRFFSGEEVTRRVEVFNDVMEPSALQLDWQLLVNDEVVDEGTKSLQLEPARHQMLELALQMPAAQRRTAIRWLLKLTRDEQVVFEDSHAYSVFPAMRLPKLSARVGLFDPVGKTKALFEAAGLEAKPVSKLETLGGDIDVLVIGAATLAASKGERAIIGRVLPERAALIDFVSRGGRVLVLEQRSYPQGLFNVSLSKHDSTMTFPLQSSHPALNGIEPDDLKFWRGDHLVSSNEPARPVSGGAAAIVASGSASGIDHAPLLEWPIGRGCIVHSQLRLAEKSTTEPAAGQVLSNLLRYLAEYRPVVRKTGVVGGSADYRGTLSSMGLQFENLTGKLPGADLSAYSLLLCRDDMAEASGLSVFLKQGGNVVLHRPTPETLKRLNRALNLDFVCHPYSGHVTRAEADDPLLGAITREDVYWLGEHVGIGWATTPRAPGMVDGVFSKTLEGKKVETHEVEEWQLEGGIVERRDPGVAFATVGSASAEIDFPVTGSYVIGVVARGTPCQGVYPIVRVSIDEEQLGTASVDGDEWQTVTAFGRVDKGRHRLSVAFINDASDPPREDRNLTVDKVVIAQDERADEVGFLTTPPATAAVRYGEGTLVIDQLRWDTEERNARKAVRYASSLLTALGGSFASRLGVDVEGEQMTPQPGMPHFNNRGTYASIACSGYVQTPIEVAVSGRYTLEIVASGSPAAGVYPLVAVRIDGKEVGQVQLTGGSWRPYQLEAELVQGTHQLQVVFLNDFNQDGEDRNLMFDKVTFYKE